MKPVRAPLLMKHFSQQEGSHRFYMKWAMRRLISKAYYGAARQYHRSGAFSRSLAYYARTIWTYPLDSRTYGATALLLLDCLLGQSRRKNVVRALRPGSWPTSWLIP